MGEQLYAPLGPASQVSRGAHGKGFTLVEVMVALVVIGVALPALLVTVYRQIDGVGYLRDKAAASWVASNVVAENRILVRSGAPLVESKDSGVEEMASRDWYWWSQIEKTTVAEMFRVTVTVAAAESDEKTPLVTLVGYMAPSVPAPAQAGE
jgi:general secretion pathway protein I